MRKIYIGSIFCAVTIAISLGGCIAPDPPPTPGSAADPQVRGSTRTPRNLLARDETTRAIEKQLSLTESTAQGAEQMQHDMSSMEHSNMPSMQHEHGKAPSHQETQSNAPQSAETKKTEAEMKKTSDEMKALSDAMKQKSDQMQPTPAPQAAGAINPPPSGPQTASAMSGNTAAGGYYTCVMHPQIRSGKPGNCPICGMKLVKKESEQ